MAYKTSNPLVVSRLERLKKFKSEKEPWLDLYQLLGEYIHTRKQNFRGEQTPGAFLTREIFDSSAPRSSKIAASSIIGLLWPTASKRFQLNPPDDLQKYQHIKQYYDKITNIIRRAMDNPKAGFTPSFDEYMLDQVIFGTSGLEVCEDEEIDVLFRAWGVREVFVDEGIYGKVDTVYICHSMSLIQLVKTYGLDSVSEVSRREYANRQYDKKVEVLIAIEPRSVRDAGKQDNTNMPFASVHIEASEEHLLKESGFQELPIKVGRFNKLLGEKYGRSPGMDALPDVLEANILWEATTVAVEKTLSPPLGVLDDGRLGGEEIDTSANAITVFNFTGRAGESNPVFPLFTVGELKTATQLLERLAQQISDHFFVDRLLDFNNETQMTLGEAQMRNRIRFSTLNSIFSRQISEVLSLVIERVFNILFKRGKLGVVAGSLEEELAVMAGETPLIIPDEVVKLMVKGADVYNIEYFTPAMRIMQAEEAEGVMRTAEFAGGLRAQFGEHASDFFEVDEALKRFGYIHAPAELIRSSEQVEEIRKARDEALKAQQQAALAQQAADAFRNVAQASPAGQKAGVA